MRITTSMVQRNVLSDLNTLSEKLAKTQSKASSGKEITRPSRRPVQHRARDGPAPEPRRQRAVPAQHRTTRWAGRTRPRPRSTRSPTTSTARRRCCCRAPPTRPTPTRATRSPTRSTRSSRVSRRRANASYGDATCCPAPRPTRAVQARRRRHLPGRRGRPGPDGPGRVREIGPGVTMSINSVGREILGDGRANPTDGKLLNVAARHLRAPEGQRHRRAARRRHRPAQDASSTRAQGPRRATAR